MTLPTTTVHTYHLHSWGSKGDPPVLLLHGFTGHGGSWAAAGERFAAAGYYVVAPDLLGHGRSPYPSSSTRYEMAHAVNDLKSLLDRSVIGAVHLLGYSMGGRLALFFALSYPEMVRSLTLVGASPGISSEIERTERRDRDDALADRIERDGIAAFVDYWTALPLWGSQKRNLSAAQRRQLKEQRLQNRPEGLANSLRGMGTGAQSPLHDRLASLAGPALLLVGEEDGKFVAVNRQMATRMPKARLVVVPGTGHAAHLERPDVFACAVLNFWGPPDGPHSPAP